MTMGKISDRLLKLESLLLVGSAEKNCGKTTLICRIIELFKNITDITAVKVTVLTGSEKIHKADNVILSNKNFCISEQFERGCDTDTARFLAAGAKKAYRLQAKKGYLEQAATELFRKIKPNVTAICESTSLRKYVVPGIFLLIRKKETRDIKPSAKTVLKLADRIVTFENGDFDLDLNDIKLVSGK